MKKEVSAKITPKSYRSGLFREYLSAIIERDILFVIIIMLAGLIYKNGALRGFPLPWLFLHAGTGRIHGMPEYFFTDLIISILIVAAGEVLNAVIRAITEPTAFRIKPSVSVFSTATESDAQKDPSHGSDNETTGSFSSSYNNGKRSIEKRFKAAAGNSSNRKEKPKDSPQKVAMQILFALMLCTVALFFTFYVLGVVNDFGDDITVNNTGTGSDDEVAFYTDSDFLHEQRDTVLLMLEDGNADLLKTVGPGDAEKLSSMADWSTADYTEEYRYVSITDPRQAYIRYEVNCGDKKYMLAVKFTGEDLRYDSSSAEIAGIAACPYFPWDKLSESSGEGYTWEDLTADVEKNTISVGDTTFYDESILLW